MITFNPIQESIQRTMKEKMRMLDKQPQLPIGEPTSNKQQNYMYTRSCFIRMTSLVTQHKKPVVLMGGELISHDAAGIIKPQYGMGIYGNRMGAGSDSLEPMDNKNKRPIAGIKDVNVEFQGAGLMAGSRRKTTINWMCWTWEEIERLQPFFLTHSRSVLVEFGWSFRGPSAPMFLNIIKENGEINEDLIRGKGKQRPLQEIIPEHILQQNGHYDAVLGIVSNFEFTVNESGGFDCTTELASSGVNILERMSSTDSVDGHISELPILEPKGPHGHLWWRENETDFTQDSEDLNPYYSFRSYMATLEGHLHLNAQDSKGSIAYQLGDDSPFCTWGWFEDNVLSRFAGQINMKNDTVIGEFRSIENVYDKKTGDIIEQQPIMMRIDKNVLPIDYSPEGWFWINPYSVEASEEGKFWNTIIKEDNSILIPEVVVVQHYQTPGIKTDLGKPDAPKAYAKGNLRRLGAHKLMFGPPYVQQSHQETGRWEYSYNDPSIKWRNTFMAGGSNRTEMKGAARTDWNYEGATFRAFTNSEQNRGVIRNIYFGHEFLSKCFESGTILEGVTEVWSKFSSAYGGIYDFGVDFDDKEGRIVIRDKGFANKRVHEVLKNKSTKENYNLDGCFVFPVWQKDSIVKSQNLTANLPDRMKMAAMYGTKELNERGNQMKGYTDFGAFQLNQKMNEHNDEKGQARFLDSLIGNMELPFKRNKEGTQDYSFGNASAFNEKKLEWRIGPTPTTTEIYEDKSNYDAKTKRIKTNSANDHWGQGINEHLTDSLTKEYSARIKEQTGFDKDELEDQGLQSDEEKTTMQKMKDRRETFSNSIRNNAQKISQLYYTGIMKEKKLLNSNPKTYIQRSGHTSQGAKYLSVDENESGYPQLKKEHKQIMQLKLNGPFGMMQNSDPLVNIELELEIDGTGGIFPGNSFHSAYLPNSYMDKVCFQALGASHQITPDGWYTTIKGQMKVAAKKPDPKPIPPPKPIILDATFTPEEREEIENDPGTQIMTIQADPEVFEGGVIEVEAPVAVTTRPIKQPPIYDLEPQNKEKSNTYKTLFPEDELEPDLGYTQIGRLDEFDVGGGTPVYIGPQNNTLKDLNNNLYKIGPDGSTGVPYNDNTSLFSPSVQQLFSDPLEWDYD